MGCKHGIVANSYKNTVNSNNAHKDHKTDTAPSDHFSITVFLSKSDNCAVSRLSAAAGPRGAAGPSHKPTSLVYIQYVYGNVLYSE